MARTDTVVGDRNRREYHDSSVAAYFRRRKELQPAERVALDMIAAEFAGRRILDIGVGGGRTTPHLLKISTNYTGLDYSSEMIRACRADRPDLDFRVADARALSEFGDGTVDLAVFAFNGIDAVGHADRLKILDEIRRVTVPGGAFLFSSHNRNVEIEPAWSLVNFELSANPLKLPLRLWRYLRGIYNHLALRRHEKTGPDYQILNNSQRYYTMLLYHIYIEDQLRQLAARGFADTIVINGKGAVLQAPQYRDKSPWIYYLCRKPGVP